MLSRLRPTTVFRAVRAFSHSRVQCVIVKSTFNSAPTPDGSFSEYLIQQVWRHSVEQPRKPAIINAVNPLHRLSYSELYLQSQSVATFLHDQDFHHGQVVGTVMPNLVEFASISLGVGLAGGVVTPASALFTPVELANQFNDSKAKIIFCADVLLPAVMEAAKSSDTVKTIVAVRCTPEKRPLPAGVVDFDDVKKTQPAMHREQIEVNPERDILVLPYSSGTTGPPKGVMISHRNMNMMVPNFLLHMQKECLDHMVSKPRFGDENALLMLPFNHILGYGALNCSLAAGCSCVVMPKYDPELFCKTIQEYKIRLLVAVPPIALFLAKHPLVSKFDLSSLEMMVCGAAPLGQELIHELKARLPHLTSVMQGFGMTEITMVSMAHSLAEDYPLQSVGKLVANFELKVVDPETGRELDYNQHGEICLRGPQVMMGYLNRPQATAETLDDEGWMHTGDVGYVDERGYTFIVDRIKELIKVKGYQVPPAELEHILLTHPKVADAAVIGVPCGMHGETPRAYIVPAAEVTAEELHGFMNDKVAPYKQLKGGIEFVKAIPKNASGKILRRMLRKDD